MTLGILVAGAILVMRSDGFTVGKGIGLGYIRNKDGVTDDYLRGGSYELEVAGVRVPATIQFDALYDPQNARSRS